MSDRPSRNEEEYFARREAELLQQRRAAAERAQVETERKSHYMKCPKCGYNLITGDWGGVEIDQCTNCHGIWFDAGEAESLVKKDDPGLMSRALRSVMRGVSGKRASKA
jgi:hypothetical protein